MSLNVEGKWWLPGESQDQPRLGTIREEADGYTLKISTDSAHHSFSNLRGYDLIYGQGLGGELFTLEDCFDRNSTSGGSGIVQKDIVVNVIYRGALLPQEPSRRLFRSAVVSFPHLKAWLGQSGFQPRLLKGNRGWDLKYRTLRPIVFHTNDGLRIEITWRAARNYPAPFDEEATIEEWAYVTFSPAEPKDLTYFDSCASTVRDFLTLSTRRVHGPSVFSLTGAWPNLRRIKDQPRRPVTMRLLRKEVYSPTGDRRLNPFLDMTFVATDMPGGLESCLRRWFQLAPPLRPVRNLFAATTAARGFLEDRFLSAVQALETLHRRIYPNHVFMEEEQFKSEVLPKLTGAVPPSVVAGHRQAMITRMGYLWEYSLRRRLKELFQEHRAALEQVFGALGAIHEEIVQTRNYLTHLPPGADHEAPEPQKLYRLTEVCRTLLEFVLMGVAGLSTTDVHQLSISKQIYLRQALQWRGTT
jgi:ApeA-like protein/HEPN superfamily Apea-like protein